MKPALMVEIVDHRMEVEIVDHRTEAVIPAHRVVVVAVVMLYKAIKTEEIHQLLWIKTNRHTIIENVYIPPTNLFLTKMFF